MIEKVTNIRKLNVIMGDLNIDLNKTNKTTKEIRNIINKNGLINSVNFNTRIDNRSST